LQILCEVDGISHHDELAIQKDARRTEVLQAVGFTILRFSDWEILNRISDISIMIGKWIEENAIVPPPDPRQRGR